MEAKRSGPAFDKALFSLLGGLVVFGLAMLASASWPLGFDSHADGYFFIKHQIFSGLLPGIVACLVAYNVPYEYYRKYARHMLLLSVLLLVLVFVPGIGSSLGTFSHSWIYLGVFSFQPSEIVKLTFLIYLSAWMEGRSKQEMKDVTQGLIPFLTVLGVIMGLLVLQPDTGSMAIIVLMSLSVYFVAGAPLRYFGFIGALGIGASAILLHSEYRAERVLTFLHPELDPQGVGYHINQALLAVGSGGFFGRGYGHSLQKFQYLPEVVGDSIFAVLAEEFGFVFTVAFVVFYAAFLLRGLKIAERAPDPFGRYLATGIMVWFGLQAFFNMGAMLHLLPITGVPFPFVSYGGTSLVVCMTAAGVVLNISKYMKGK